MPSAQDVAQAKEKSHSKNKSVGTAFQGRTSTHKTTHSKNIVMLTVRLIPNVTAKDIGTNEPYLLAYLMDQDLKVGFVTPFKVGITDGNGTRWTIPVDFLQDWPQPVFIDEPFKTVGAELTNGARL
jgi:hypothetical protein